MDLIEAIVIGIIQGITEWLPISSEAMIVLVEKYLFNREYQEGLSNAIWLHFGTFISATIYFREDLIKIFQKERRELLLFLIISTILTGILAFPLLLLAFEIDVPDYLFTIFIGVFLIVISRLQKNQKFGQKEEIVKEDGILAGLIQGLAVLPGFSRSGLTTATLIFQKYSLKSAFYLSFLMSIPVTFAAQIALPIIREDFLITNELIISAIVAAIVGFFSMDYLIKFARKVNFSKATLTLGVLVILIGIMSLLF